MSTGPPPPDLALCLATLASLPFPAGARDVPPRPLLSLPSQQDPRAQLPPALSPGSHPTWWNRPDCVEGGLLIVAHLTKLAIRTILSI